MDDRWSMSIMMDDDLHEDFSYWLGLTHIPTQLSVSGFMGWPEDDSPMIVGIDANDLLLPSAMAERLLAYLHIHWWDNVAHGLTVERGLRAIVDGAYDDPRDAREVREMIERALHFVAICGDIPPSP